MSKKKTLVLLDAHAILHRAYHALPEDFTSAKGEPTGALYGLSLMLLKIIGDLKPDYIISCFDLPKPTFRHQMYKEYKAGRKKADGDLVSQIKRSRDIFEAFNIPIYDKEGFEADDILGTIVEKMKGKKDLDIIIASGDMDTLQLVEGKKIRVYTLKKGIKDTIIYDEKAVKDRFGFGPKLLPDYKGLRGDPSDNIIGIKGIGEKTATTLITKFGSLKDIYKALKKSKKPFEKAGLTPRIISLLEENEDEAMFSRELGEIRTDAPIKFSLPKLIWPESIEPTKVLDLYKELSFRALGERVKAMFNVVEEEKVEEDVKEKDLQETSLALWVLSSDTTNPTLEDILDFAREESFSKAKKYIFDQLKKQELLDVFEKIEKPLIPVVKEMKEKGILIDQKYLKNLSKKYHKELEKFKKEIWKHAGREFNINSPKQLSEVLFEEMKLSLKRHKKTSTGVKSTRESELLKMKDLHPIIGEILKYRELQKLLSTYIDNIPEMVLEDERLHATFLQAGTTTGRMASQNPNLQNIPIRSELGKKIRNAFVAKKNYKLVALDYSQIELRIAAFLSKDKKLIEIFKKGEDIHNAVASEVFGVTEDKVTSNMRRQAKIINFGILYGMGINALRTNLDTDRETAQDFYNSYINKFSGLAEYLDKVKEEAKKKGYTETYFKRRRYFPNLRSKFPFLRAQAERMAINAPIQGTSADIIKLAMIKVDKYLKKNNFKAHLLLQVHDELVYEIEEKKTKEIAKEIKKIMEEIILPKEIEGIKLEVDINEGNNWGEMTKID